MRTNLSGAVVIWCAAWLTVSLVSMAACSNGTSQTSTTVGTSNVSTASTVSSGGSQGGSSSSSSGGASTASSGGGVSSTSSTGSTEPAPDAGPPQPAGADCSSDLGCLSGSCAGNSICCAAACSKTVAACGAICAPQTGSCVYPDAGQSCSEGFCHAGEVAPAGRCDGAGNCTVPAFETCFPYGCHDLQNCNSLCQDNSDCAAAATCFHSDAGGSCVLPLASGAICSQDDNCSSLACAGGRCCVQGCRGDQGVCGPASCDENGACGPVGPVNTVCLASACGGSSFQGASTCDGMGSCQTPAATVCSPFGCDQSGCLGTCAGDAQCDPNLQGNYCDHGSCCSLELQSLGQVLVDGVAGADVPCCGSVIGPSGTSAPCQTVGYAMQRVADYNNSHLASLLDSPQIVVINSGVADWAPAAGEQWPIHLGWGVTLNAPGVYFSAPADGGALFTIAPYPGEPSNPPAPVNLSGAGGAPLVIGSTASGVLTKAANAIDVQGPAQLVLNTVSAYGAACTTLPCGNQAAIRVGPGATLNFGASPNNIGNPNLPNATVVEASGATGVLCSGVDAGVGDPNSAAPSVWIQGMRRADLDAERGCSINFGFGPQFGETPTGPGVGTCPSSPKIDSIGILASGAVSLLVAGPSSSALIACQDQYGIRLLADDAGAAPTLTAYDTNRITNCGCAGISASAGSVQASLQVVAYNQIGVEQQGSAQVNVDTSGFASTIACNGKAEPSTVCQTPAGVDVLNLSTASLLAENDAWSTYDNTVDSTLVWSCTDATLRHCTCHGIPSICQGYSPGQALPDGTPAAYLASNPTLEPINSGGFNSSMVGCP